jgi:UDP-sugar transporter A1/2/3
MSLEKYFATTAVVLSEVLKLIICLLIYSKVESKSPGQIVSDIYSSDFWKLLIPAGLYTIQNNLQYLAASTLDAATFQVTYQLKILTTALFSVVLLNRSLSRMKWFSLVILTIGIALVQFPSSNALSADSNSSDRIVGMIAVSCACLISGLAGVYFERILKGSSTSLWIRNIQLSLLSIFPGLLFGVYMIDGQGVTEKGFFYGYNSITWMAIFTQASGGLIVAMVVKYADNILKGFATSLSIVLSSIASMFLFDFHISYTFVIGTSLVIYATYLYGLPDSTVPNKNANSDTDLSEVKVNKTLIV